MEEKSEKRYGVSSGILLAVLFSFLGWCMEMAVCRIETGRWVARGFLALPICPIYGVCVWIAYAVLGTPKQGKGLLKNAKKGTVRVWYGVCAFLIPSLAELLVGYFFDKMYHVKLWTYSAWKYNLCGYVCLPVSCIWAVMLFLIMRYVYPFFQKRIERIPLAWQRKTAFFFMAVTLVDGLVQFCKISFKG